jgi:hypothetical protein
MKAGMAHLFASALVAVCCAWPAAWATAGARTVPLTFHSHDRGLNLEDQLRGYETVDYVMQAHAGERLAVHFAVDNRAAYFNVLTPASDSAVFVGATEGHQYEGPVTEDGLWRVRVYLMRSAARRNERAHYRLSISLHGVQRPAPAARFFRQ